MRKNFVDPRELSVLSLDELVRLLKLLDLEQSDVIARAFLNLYTHATHHELDHLFA